MQGVGRKDQNALMDLFLARTSTATGLADSSFLTALDMEASASSGSALSSPSLHHTSAASPTPTGLNVFASGLPSLVSGSASSRDGSRVPTPIAGFRGGEESRGKEALQEFKKIGSRIGLASRLFGQH